MWRLRARPMDLGDDDEVRGKVSVCGWTFGTGSRGM